jgi:hypothetical protein
VRTAALCPPRALAYPAFAAEPVVPVGIRVVAALAGRVFRWTRPGVDVAYFYRNDTEPSLPHAEKQSQIPRVYTCAPEHERLFRAGGGQQGPRSIRKIIVMITCCRDGRDGNVFVPGSGGTARSGWRVQQPRHPRAGPPQLRMAGRPAARTDLESKASRASFMTPPMRGGRHRPWPSADAAPGSLAGAFRSAPLLVQRPAAAGDETTPSRRRPSCPARR